MREENFFQNLLNKRIVLLDDDINDKLIDRIKVQMIFLSNEDKDLPIYLYIDSKGGMLRDSLFLYDFIKALPTKVIAIVNGKACSSAFLAMLACGQKKSTPHSLFMIHGTRHEIVVRFPADNNKFIVEEKLKEAEDLFSKVLSIYEKELNVDKNRILEIMKNSNETEVFINLENVRQLGVNIEEIENFNY